MLERYTRPVSLLSSKYFNLNRWINQNKATVRPMTSNTQTDTKVIPNATHHLILAILKPYFDSNPTALTALSLLNTTFPNSTLAYDHFAFRTFAIQGMGISSLASIFLDYGYSENTDELLFPSKKLRAKWYSPPHQDLPRIFISELLVDELSPECQAIIHKYVNSPPGPAIIGKHAITSALMGTPPWPACSLVEFQTVSKESEYAAWCLTNGYSLNHTTVSVHRIQQLRGGIEELNALLENKGGFVLNREGGAVKTSPDGLLLQSSTVADTAEFVFADGVAEKIPASYIEFAERMPLPEWQGRESEELDESKRRDGFETGNADKIFESTKLAGK